MCYISTYVVEDVRAVNVLDCLTSKYSVVNATASDSSWMVLLLKLCFFQTVFSTLLSYQLRFWCLQGCHRSSSPALSLTGDKLAKTGKTHLSPINLKNHLSKRKHTSVVLALSFFFFSDARSFSSYSAFGGGLE